MAHDMRNLRLIQEAAETDHLDWSEAASIRAKASEIGIEYVQRIDQWGRGIQELPPNDAHKVTQSEQAVSIQVSDPETFRITVMGPNEDLIQLCESGIVSVTAIDSSCHSLLRVFC